MTRERVPSNEFRITQEFLALMLGVRRVGINVAMRSLRERKVIGYRRGTITILDHKGLVAAACGCYKTVKDSYTRAQAQRGIPAQPNTSNTDFGRPRTDPKAGTSKSEKRAQPDGEKLVAAEGAIEAAHPIARLQWLSGRGMKREAPSKFDEVLKRMLTTPPQPHQPKPKARKARQEKPAR